MKSWLKTLLRLWNRLKSNQTFVVLSGLFYGALGDTIFEEIQTGRLDLSKQGLHRMLVSAAGTSFIAWWHLRQPAPAMVAAAAAPSLSQNQPLPLPISQSTEYLSQISRPPFPPTQPSTPSQSKK